MLLDDDGHITAFAAITDVRTNENRIAPGTLELPRGSIMVFDKSYVYHNWFPAPGARHISFVTRLKRNVVCKLLERCPVSRRSGVTSDHFVEVASCGKPLHPRRRGYRTRESGRPYQFMTNHLGLSAKTIADIYKARWQIELFFKEIK